ncbi:MAG: thiopeptide-type bacteriocin biosynthesis protein, partial [Chitinophagales bacterium]
DNCWIESNDGKHTGEFIFAFTRKEIIHEKIPLNHPKGEKVPLNFAKRENKRIERYFNVGSEWLYVKIYCGTKIAEKFLTEIIKPFTEELLEKQVIDMFFFVRYADPDHHIRIRFHHGENKVFWEKVLERFNELVQPYVDAQLIYNIQIETYQRETERYGVESIELSEELFYYNSRAVLNFISLLYGDAGEQYRWKVALKATDMLLDDFAFSTIQKRDLLKWLRDSYVAEFNIGASQQKKISEKYNNLKKEIYMIMNENYDDPDLQQVINSFKIDDQRYYSVITEIKKLADKNNHKKLPELMGSYIHMFLNRMFISNQRKHELVIYDFLLKYYISKIAQDKSPLLPLKTEQIAAV